MTKPLAIVQARLHSTRVPRKMLQDVGGHPLVWWAWKAAVEAFGAANVVVAIPASADNDELAVELASFAGAVFRWDGAENDVLGRLAACAAAYRPRHRHAVIVRVTPDDWRKDPMMLRLVAQEGMSSGAYPVELGGEACYNFVLAAADRELDADDPRREHLGHWLYETSVDVPAPGVWTIDTYSDLEAARRMCSEWVPT